MTSRLSWRMPVAAAATAGTSTRGSSIEGPKMAIVLFLVNCHRACVGSLCVPARCGALCLLQRQIAPQLSQSRAAGGGRGGGSGGSVQYLHSIYTISTLSTEGLLYLRSLHSHTAAAETMLQRRRAVVGPEPRLRAATRRLSLFLD